jgi:hypothetical protein
VKIEVLLPLNNWQKLMIIIGPRKNLKLKKGNVKQNYNFLDMTILKNVWINRKTHLKINM